MCHHRTGSNLVFRDQTWVWVGGKFNFSLEKFYLRNDPGKMQECWGEGGERKEDEMEKVLGGSR